MICREIRQDDTQEHVVGTASSARDMKLRNVVFPQQADGGQRDSEGEPVAKWDVELVDGYVTVMEPAADLEGDGMASRLLLPPLCHPHLHLDKAYLLTSCCTDHVSRDEETHVLPRYDDLLPRTGSFAEALQTTATAKARFTAADLHRRGTQLLAASWQQGVTAARVFVEVDAAAAGGGRTAVAVARQLQGEWRGRVAVQICAFAQEAVVGDAGTAARANREAMEAVLQSDVIGDSGDAADGPGIRVLGSAPYVEASRAEALQNLDWAVATALARGLHLDLLDALERHRWTERAGRDRHGRLRTVTVGHATQLTRLPAARLRDLAAAVRQRRLPVHLVGLPTSDMYMMGRVEAAAAEAVAEDRGKRADVDGPPRGTLNVPALVRLGWRACLGVNNVGNAFTPHGTGDPLQLASWGVGLYHAGTVADASVLYGAVSWRSRAAMGIGADYGEEEDDDDDDDKADGTRNWWTVADPRMLVGRRIGPVLVLANPRFMDLSAVGDSGDDGASDGSLPPVPAVPARARTGFRDVVWDPPETRFRRVVGTRSREAAIL